MSDPVESGVPLRFCAEYAKSGRSACKHSKCKGLIADKSLRLGKIIENPFKEGSEMPVWFHPDCLFENLKMGRTARLTIESTDDVDGFDSLTKKDQDDLKKRIGATASAAAALAAPSSVKYLECTTGGESKFWEMSVAGSTTKARWGQIGDKDGLSQVKEHDTEAKAEAFAAKMVAEKLKKGYVEASKEGAAAKAAAPPAKKAAGGGSAEDDAPALRFCVEYAKSARSSCKNARCKGLIENAAMRLGKIIKNPFTDSGAEMAVWYHPACLFASLKMGKTGRQTIGSTADVEGFDTLKKADQTTLRKSIEDNAQTVAALAAPSSVTYLECTEGGENKFWEVSVAGSLTNVRWGLIGTDGTSLIKEHDSQDKAEKFAASAAAQKLKKGYVNVGVPGLVKSASKVASAPKEAAAKGKGKRGAEEEEEEEVVKPKGKAAPAKRGKKK